MPVGHGKSSEFPWTYDNWGTDPTATPGTSVTPGTSGSEGSWTTVASSVSIANDVYGFHLQISGGTSSTSVKNHFVDVGVDPAGGTSYSAIISNIACGGSPTLLLPGSRQFFFPHFIKAASSVAVRVQGSNATAGTVRAMVKFFGKPSMPEAIPVGYYSETFGASVSTRGTGFTPGNAADGSWTSLGTTTKDLWWWQLGYQVSNAAVTAEYTYIDLAYGDASNKHLIQRIMHGGTTAEVVGVLVGTNCLWHECYAPVPAGTSIYVRGRCNNAPDTDYNAVAIGIGG